MADTIAPPTAEDLARDASADMSRWEALIRNNSSGDPELEIMALQALPAWLRRANHAEEAVDRLTDELMGYRARARLAEVDAGRLGILFGWEAGELSEGQAATLLGCPDDPVALREFRQVTIDKVREYWKRIGTEETKESGNG